MGYFQPGVATGYAVSIPLWLRAHKMEDALISSFLLMRRLTSGTVIGNCQTLRLANWSLCRARSKALWELKWHVILPAVTEVVVSLGREDMYMSNRK